MANLTLWEQIKELKSPKYKWVDLTHELSPETPHWFGFKPLQADLLFDYAEGTPDDMMAPMRCIQYSVASQYGTHTDVPLHFWGNGRSMAEITVKELIYPLVVIDKSAECAANPEARERVKNIKFQLGSDEKTYKRKGKAAYRCKTLQNLLPENTRPGKAGKNTGYDITDNLRQL